MVLSPPQRGQMNMAIDEAILLVSVKNHGLPTLRLYSWEPGCLSLGYAQPCSDIDEQALATNGWDLVRRPTGGKAILHIDEITYSITSCLDNPAVTGDILQSYRHLSRGLLKALEILGVSANADKEYGTPVSQQNRPVCFETPSNYEITVSGKKLIGSAQSRKMGGVLQHGTLPLVGDIARITKVLSYPDEKSRLEAQERVYTHACTLEGILHSRIPWEAAAHAMTSGFESALNVSINKSQLSDEELEKADELMRTKYTTREWNCKQ